MFLNERRIHDRRKTAVVKKLNSDIVRDLIYKEGPISKPEIAEKTALSLPTVKRVDILLREGWIRTAGRSGEGVGRKAEKYEAPLAQDDSALYESEALPRILWT